MSGKASLLAVPPAPLPPVNPEMMWLLHDLVARDPVVTLDSPVIADLLGARPARHW